MTTNAIGKNYFSIFSHLLNIALKFAASNLH